MPRPRSRARLSPPQARARLALARHASSPRPPRAGANWFARGRVVSPSRRADATRRAVRILRARTRPRNPRPTRWTPPRPTRRSSSSSTARAAGGAARNSRRSSRSDRISTPWTSSTLADAVRARRSSGTRARCPTCASSCAAATEPSRGSCRPSKISPRCDANPPPRPASTRVRYATDAASRLASRPTKSHLAARPPHDDAPSPPLPLDRRSSAAPRPPSPIP
jgi:hypothetical protein